MISSLKQLINLSCDKLEYGQSPSILELYLGDFKLVVECSWLCKNGGNLIDSSKIIKDSDALPELKGSKIINIGSVGDSAPNINISFDNGSVFEIRQNNSKYEAWQLYKNDKLIVVAGPGDILNEF